MLRHANNHGKRYARESDRVFRKMKGRPHPCGPDAISFAKLALYGACCSVMAPLIWNPVSFWRM